MRDETVPKARRLVGSVLFLFFGGIGVLMKLVCGKRTEDDPSNDLSTQGETLSGLQCCYTGAGHEHC